LNYKKGFFNFLGSGDRNPKSGGKRGYITAAGRLKK